MAWIDYKKADDMVLQIWIIEFLKMFKISELVIIFHIKAMENWEVELTAGGQTKAEIKIQSSIFQRDSLLQLVFIIAMIPLNYVLRNASKINKVGELSQG